MGFDWADGGTLGVLPLGKPGKYVPSDGSGMLHAHGSGITDWAFSDFSQDVLATGAEDGTVSFCGGYKSLRSAPPNLRILQVKIWKLPENGITAGDQASTLAVLNVQSPRANSVKFHPTAENVTSSSI